MTSGRSHLHTRPVCSDSTFPCHFISLFASWKRQVATRWHKILVPLSLVREDGTQSPRTGTQGFSRADPLFSYSQAHRQASEWLGWVIAFLRKPVKRGWEQPLKSNSGADSVTVCRTKLLKSASYLWSELGACWPEGASLGAPGAGVCAVAQAEKAMGLEQAYGVSVSPSEISADKTESWAVSGREA